MTQLPTGEHNSRQHQAINDLIETILQVTLLDGKAKEFLTLAGLRDELSAENVQPVLNEELIERCLVHVLSLPGNSDVELGYRCLRPESSQSPSVSEKALAHYLVECWSRGSQRISLVDDIGKHTCRKIMQLCVSYTGLLLEYPGMFPQPNDVVSAGSSILLSYIRETSGSYATTVMSTEMLNQLAAGLARDALMEVFGPVIMELSSEMRNLNINNNFMPPLQTLYSLVQLKPVASLITEMPAWNPSDMPSRSFEIATILGPFFRISPLGTDDGRVAVNIFGDKLQRLRSDVDSAQTSMRFSLESLNQTLHRVLLCIIKSSPNAKEAVLEWIATIIRLNQERTKLVVSDPNKVSTDGFIFNVFSVLLKLAEPVMDPNFSKINLINPNYLQMSVRINVSNFTKINATAPEEENFYAKGKTCIPNQENFVTEIFFLTIWFMHLSFHRLVVAYGDVQKDLRESMKNLDQLRADEGKWMSSSRAGMYKGLLVRIESHVSQLSAVKLSCDIVMNDEKFLECVIQFSQLIARFILKLIVSPSIGIEYSDLVFGKGVYFRSHAKADGISLPLSIAPDCFRMLPEFFVEDIAEILIHCSQYIPGSIVPHGSTAIVDDFISLGVILLQCRSVFSSASRENDGVFVKNPYLIAKLVEVFFLLTLDYGPGSNINFAVKNLIGAHSIALQHLVSGLLVFYVDVEKTGHSSQFYDKFGIRYNISRIIKYLWESYPLVYKDKIKEESTARWDIFVKFINLLMNDTTYLLDEGLGKLVEIRVLQNEMESSAWMSLADTEKTEKEKKLKDLERGAQSCIQLANESVGMLRFLTSYIIDPFLRPEIIDRLAAMLNFNLVLLVGPKCTDLKVRNPEKYGFNPKQLLSDIIDVYLNLSQDSRKIEFKVAVARDGRSYSRSHFEKAANILLSKGLKAQETIGRITLFVEQVEEIIGQDLAEEADLGEIPDEFLDPLMFTLMEDPVTLPSSRTIVDRSTIVSHLLSDATDPFNRVPLNIDMVIPATDLKQKIHEWRKSKRRLR